MAGICRFIGYAGYYITQPKYIESQYRKSASKASLFTGKNEKKRSIRTEAKFSNVLSNFRFYKHHRNGDRYFGRRLFHTQC